MVRQNIANMEHFYDGIHGWFDYADIYRRMVSEASSGSHFVEVGVHQGRSAAFMAVEIANSGKLIDFDCIDPWDGRNENGHGYSNSLESFESNMSPAVGYYNAKKETSPEAADSYEDGSLDFVWIDALHTYEHSRADILAWLPKIRHGGYIGGHDYAEENGIARSVDEILPHREIYKGELVMSWLARVEHQKHA